MANPNPNPNPNPNHKANEWDLKPNSFSEKPSSLNEEPEEQSKEQKTFDQKFGADDCERIAMTGASSFFGGLILKRLVAMPGVREIHVLDVRIPELRSNKIIFHKVDLVKDSADAEMAQILISQRVSLFLHGALFSAPHRGTAKCREIESIGTFHVLNAIAEARVKRLLVLSNTFVYGAHANNPNFIQESQALRLSGPQFVKTRVDVEKQVLDFAKDYPTTCVTLLRFAPILGPTSTHVFARYFLTGLIPKPLGYDPLLQFIHEDDAQNAAVMTLFRRCPGVFNIVGKGVIPLSTAIHLAGRLPWPVPGFVCRTVFGVGYLLRLWDLQPNLVPFYQYLCVASGEKASKELAFRPLYSSRQALKSMIEAQRLRNVGFAVPSSILGEDEAAVRATSFERVG